MFLYVESVDAMCLANSSNLLDLVPDTSVGLTGCFGQGPNIICGDIESLNDIWCTSAGSWIRNMGSECSTFIMLRHDEIALLPLIFSAFRSDRGSLCFSFILYSSKFICHIAGIRALLMVIGVFLIKR